ncbi:NUDIX hydrolase [Mycoplasma leonicaptivi]|uniref:NUDIX hydrolase n=1 Tax=Mycoplasma leonicaptivi TaxID=36742 RepID=UPI000489E976|nr:NUDIX domain-containing protein [Mycoplasma leonicaptivi]
MKDILITNEENFRFKLRVGAIIKYKNKILITSDPWNNYWYLPGGKSTFGESTQQTLEREIKEELNCQVDTFKFAFLTENFYTKADNIKYHELCFYYSIKLKSYDEITQKNEFIRIENGNKFRFKWVSKKELKGWNFHPNIVIDQIWKMLSNKKLIIIK